MPWPNIVWPSFHKLSPLSPYSIVSWYVHSPFMGGKGWLCIRKWKTVSSGLVGLSDDILPNNAPAHIPALCLHRFANSVSAAAIFTSRYCSLHMGRIMQPVQSFGKNEYFSKERYEKLTVFSKFFDVLLKIRVVKIKWPWSWLHHIDHVEEDKSIWWKLEKRWTFRDVH